ncbi:MAG: aldehyde ferredoxin oxidoreductase family protein [Dehalococcoidia bacterium]
MTYGWTGKILRVNLTNSTISVEELNRKAAEGFIGARGLGAKYLYDEIDPTVDALDPANKLIFATGPLTGTGAPAASRYMVVTKAPLTGTIGNSNAGGFFPAELKLAGFDQIIFEGRARTPVYLWIENDRAEIRDATDLWGKPTGESEEAIRVKTDEFARVACIGPAGESLVRFANIINDRTHAAGRSGVGAVMGSKNLKAVAVRGTKGVKVADVEGFRQTLRRFYEEFNSKERIEATGFLSEWGTPGCVEIVTEFGVLPTRNFRSAVFEGADKINGQTFAETISVRGKRGNACYACPLACRRESRVLEPEEFAGAGGGPEYETIGAFGACCGIDDLRAIAKANYICNDTGMDTITCGMTIACAMELFEKGVLTEKDVGMRLDFGDHHGMVRMVDKIAKREGFGHLLAEGSYRLAQEYGHPELFMGVKKQEFACYDPRSMQGHALAYVTSNRGACHIRGEVGDVELYGTTNMQIYGFDSMKLVDPHITKGKARLCKAVQDHFAVIDSAGMCNFICIAITYEMLGSFLSTATGVDYTAENMLVAGERIFNLERLFNIKAGFTKGDDILPKRMLEDPLPDGPHKGYVVMLGEMLPEYYRVRGWDENGVPTREKMVELGLV